MDAMAGERRRDRAMPEPMAPRPIIETLSGLDGGDIDLCVSLCWGGGPQFFYLSLLILKQ